MNQQPHSHRYLTTNILVLAALGLTMLAACGEDTTAGTAATTPRTVGTIEAPSTPATITTEAPSTSTTPTTEAHGAERGAVVDLRLQASVPVAEMQSLLDQVQLPGLTEAQYGMAIWRVTYETIDIDGQPTTASGTIIVPEGAIGPLPVVSDQHGTQTDRLSPDAPPMANEIYSAGLLFATQGYLVVGADYLGLGESRGLHPYYHADSEASAALDMLRAARSAVLDLGVAFGDELFLAGYSQGAHVTMALHREIEQGDEFAVTASAPMAGAYDLDSVSVPMSIAAPAVSTPLYLTYAVLGLDQVYGFVNDWNEVFLDPYAETAFDLFDGGADADVPFRNAEVAAARMTDLGADVQVVNVGAELDHTTASTPSYIGAKAWFDSILEGSR